MKVVLMALGLGMLAGAAIAADLPCVTGERRGGVDFSLPCNWRSPISADDAVVRFAAGSADLSSEARVILDRQADILRRHPDLPMTVWGHVDTDEAKAPNGEALGFQRAVAVRNHLVSRGISPERISTNSRGNRWIIPNNPSVDALAKMRFVSTETEDNR